MTIPASVDDARPSGWRRFWANLTAFAEAMEMSETEFLQRRIAALEADMAALKRQQGGQ